MQTTIRRLTSGTTSTGIALRVERDGDTARIVHAATGNTASDSSGPLVYNQGPGSWTCAREALGLIIDDQDATAELVPDTAEQVEARQLRDGDVIVNSAAEEIPVLLAGPHSGLTVIWTSRTNCFAMSPSLRVNIKRRNGGV